MEIKRYIVTLGIFELSDGNWLVEVEPPWNRLGKHTLREEFDTKKQAEDRYNELMKIAIDTGLKLNKQSRSDGN